MMIYNFPKIKSLKQVEKAIDGRDEFIVAEREFGYVVNYLVNYEDTFPPVNTFNDVTTEKNAILRECRGIKFDHDGKLIARTLHKFFNMNERPETIKEIVDFTAPYVLFDKLDGSMIHPIVCQEQVTYCTKMGITDVAGPAQLFADQKGRKAIFYNDFCWDLMLSGYTPTFEWCSRQQRIVVDYPEDKLILTAIRKMESGAYLGLSEMHALADPYRVPVVGTRDSTTDLDDFITMARARVDEEGYIIRFNNGHMLKIKNLWYLQLHKIKALLEFEKDVWALVLDEKQDDAKSVMENDESDRIDAFTKDLFDAIHVTADRLNQAVVSSKESFGDDKKRFAMETVPQFDGVEKGLLFKIWDGADPVGIVRDYIRSHLGSQTKVDIVRSLVGGIKWERY